MAKLQYAGQSSWLDPILSAVTREAQQIALEWEGLSTERAPRSIGIDREPGATNGASAQRLAETVTGHAEWVNGGRTLRITCSAHTPYAGVQEAGYQVRTFTTRAGVKTQRIVFSHYSTPGTGSHYLEGPLKQHQQTWTADLARATRSTP